MDALTPARLLLLEPAMGFGPARLVMAPVGGAGAPRPAGVHAVEGIVVPAPITSSRFGQAVPISVASSRRPSLVVGALPMGGRATGFHVAPVAARAGTLLDSTVAAAAAGSSSTKGRRGVIAIGSSPRDVYPEEEDDDEDDASEPADLSDEYHRSKKHIAYWVELARLQTTFEVAFDAGVVKSGRDLRRVLDAIGDINLTAPSRPWGLELCLDRISNIVGKEMLDRLKDARTPDDDVQFRWSALAAQSVIEGMENLMAMLLGLLHQYPDLPISTSCPVIIKQSLKVVCEFSTIIESTKFRKPQSSIRYRLLEAHALALEHACTIALDVYEEALQKVPKDKWIQLRQQLMNRRITLFEQDMGVTQYTVDTGVEDTQKVYDLLNEVVVEVKNKARVSEGTG